MPASNTANLFTKVLPVFLLLLVGLLYFLFIASVNKTESVTASSTVTQVLPAFQKQQLSPINTVHEKALAVEAFDDTSLRATEIDRAIIDVYDGKIILHGGLLFYFDYFLNLQGEKALSVIKQLLLADVKAHYPEDIAEQIYALFERYLNYLSAVSERMDNTTSEELLQQGVTVKQWENDIRHEFFSVEEVEQLFGSYQNMLSQPTKAAAQLKNHEKYQQVINAHPESQDAIATELFGVEAAQRLRKLEQEREHWQQRLFNYRSQKEDIIRSASLDDYGKREAVQLLQERLFSEAEVRRVKTLEQNSVIN